MKIPPLFLGAILFGCASAASVVEIGDNAWRLAAIDYNPTDATRIATDQVTAFCAKRGQVPIWHSRGSPATCPDATTPRWSFNARPVDRRPRRKRRHSLGDTSGIARSRDTLWARSRTWIAHWKSPARPIRNLARPHSPTARSHQAVDLAVRRLTSCPFPHPPCRHCCSVPVAFRCPSCGALRPSVRRWRSIPTHDPASTRRRRPSAQVIAEGRTVYGVNTGFGLLARTRIDDARLARAAARARAVALARAPARCSTTRSCASSSRSRPRRSRAGIPACAGA